MKVKEKKSTKEQVPFDPILFAVTVPSRQPTLKDRADAKERPDDAIEPKDHDTMNATVEEFIIDHDVVVSFSIGPHSIVSK